MSFDIILKEFNDSVKATGSILLDWDGEIVASCAGSQKDLDLIGAHHGIVLNIIKDAAARSHSDKVNYVSISTEKARLMIFTIKEGYYLVVVVGRTSYMGQVLRCSNKVIRAIETEMG